MTAPCRHCGSRRTLRHYEGPMLRPARVECADGRRCERRRILRALRALRLTWRARQDATTGEAFEGAARAVQVLDEALAAVKPRRT